MKRNKLSLRVAGLVGIVAGGLVAAGVIACGSSETVTVVVPGEERVVERVVTVEVPVEVTREAVVVQTVEVEREVQVTREEVVVQTVEVEVQREVQVEVPVEVQVEVTRESVVVQTVEVEVEREVEVEVVSSIPRSRTMVTGTRFGQGVNFRMWSPYAIGGTHQKGVAFFHEPLYYSDSLNGNSYPWLATSFEYNNDATTLTYKLRDGVFWSDGEAFNAEDVAYTFNALAQSEGEVRGGGVFRTFVEDAEIVDPLTVQINFKFPAPRFHAEVVIYKGDSGTYIVPEHVWSDEDWTTYDAYNDGAGPVTTGAWRLSYSDQFRRVLDRVRTCEQYWGCATNFTPLPEVERYVLYNIVDDTGLAQALINNQIDETHDLRVDTVETILRENPKATTYTGRDADGEWGMVSWWPISLHINGLKPHLDNSDVRTAISKYINRERVNASAYLNKGRINKWPWPQYAGLAHVNAAMEPLAEEFGLGEYDSDGADALLTAAGYTKNSDDLWADANGDTIKCNIIGSGHFTDLGPALASTLQRHGIDSSWSQPPDVWARNTKGGDFECSLVGHNGSQSGDVYRTLLAYTTDNGGNRWSYSNAEFDAIVESMAREPDTQKVLDLTEQALRIWLTDMPDVPLFEFFNRVARNETYWTNWPADAPGYEPYMNGIHPHTGFPYILGNLKAAQ